MSVIESRNNREEYLSNLLNQAPDLDLRLMEAVKLLMMLNAVKLHEQMIASRSNATKTGRDSKRTG